MNQGGEQGHDDYGLPPVDIEVPDDARELYRDVQAYHRELRALRRHQRSLRWRAPFRRSGVAIPLLAGCLIVALVAVMISAMLTTNSELTGPGRPESQPGNRSSSSSIARSPSQPASTGQNSNPGSSRKPSTISPAGTRLPAKTISLAGKPLALASLRGTALAIVPGNCGCAAAVTRLLTQAELTGVAVYLVGPRGTSTALLTRLAGLVRGQKPVKVAADAADVLTSAFHPAGLTVLLVDSRGVVTEHKDLGPKLSLEKQLRLLRPTS